MTETLAKLELPTEGPRGPDASCEITVPAEWLVTGRRIQIDVPARLTCAVCAGGGCDACGRSGALDVPKAETPLELTLPSTQEGTVLRVRLAALGAPGQTADEPRGHLILSVRASDQASRCVRLCPTLPVKVTTADPQLALRILTMVVLVSLLFVFLLHFSGWL